jgi:hypothetical protein
MTTTYHLGALVEGEGVVPVVGGVAGRAERGVPWGVARRPGSGVGTPTVAGEVTLPVPGLIAGEVPAMGRGLRRIPAVGAGSIVTVDTEGARTARAGAVVVVRILGMVATETVPGDVPGAGGGGPGVEGGLENWIAVGGVVAGILGTGGSAEVVATTFAARRV